MPDGRFVIHAVALLANDDNALRTFHSILKPEYFEVPEIAWTIRQILHRWSTTGTAPGTEWLRARYESLDDGRLRQMSRALLERLLDDTEHPPTGKTKQAVLIDLESVIKRGAVKHAIITAAELIDQDDDDGAFQVMEEAKQVRLLADNWTKIPPDDLDAFIKRRQPEHMRELTVPTGMRHLDEFLNGGIRPGELGVFLASTGRGKSMLLNQVAIHALTKKFNNVYFSFENSMDETEARAMANLANIPIDDLGSATAKQFRNAIRQLGSNGAQVYAQLLPGSKTSTDTLSASLTRLEEEGVEIGMVIVDYGDLMRSIQKHERKYDEQSSVFEELRDLATYHNVPVWTATQGNRKSLEDPWVGLEHFADSFAKAFTADIVIAKCDGRQDQRDIDHCDAYLRICKFRRGRPNRAIKLVEALDRARFRDLGEAVNTDYSRRAPSEGPRSDASEDR